MKYCTSVSAWFVWVVRQNLRGCYMLTVAVCCLMLIKRCSQSAMSSFFILCYLQVGIWNLLYSHLVKLAVIMQPPADGVQQCLFIGVVVSSQASPTSFSFPPSSPSPKKKTQQVKIWWCECMSSQWMWQHCPSKICDGCFGAHTCVCPQHHGGATIQELFLWVELSEGKHSEFLVFQYSSWSLLLSPEAASSQEWHLFLSPRL